MYTEIYTIYYFGGTFLVFFDVTYHSQTLPRVSSCCVVAGLCGIQVSSPGGAKERHGSDGAAGGDGRSGTIILKSFY